MNRSTILFFRTWALGLTAWALVYTKEVPVAFAQAPIETDCSTDLDQPDTTYILSATAVQNCVIAADNIILDGQSLYGLDSYTVYSNAAARGFTVRNLLSGELRATYKTDEATITVENSTFSYAYGFQNEGDVNIIDSTFTDDSDSTLFIAGNLVIENSTIAGSFNGGEILITDSTIEDIRVSTSLEITDSTVQGVVSGYDNAVVTVTNSTLQTGMDFNDDDDVDITVIDSVIGAAIDFRSGNVTVTNSTVDGAVDAYNTGYVTVTDSTIHGEIDMYTGSISVTRSLVEGDVGRGDILLEDSTVTGSPNLGAYGTCTLIDNPPSLTVSPLDLSLDYGEDFNPFSGVSADDIKDDDLSSEVVVIGEVGQEEGSYELLYSVTDYGTSFCGEEAGPSTATTTRTVTRGNKPTESTSVGVYKERKEKEATQEASLPDDTTALIETLRTTLNEPGATNDPEALKQIIDLVRQLIVALFELMAAQGKLK